MKLLHKTAATAAILATLSVSPLQTAHAVGEELTTNYTVSLIGLPVGRASFVTTVDGKAFSVKGTLASTGLADIVSKTSGTSVVSGTIAGDKLYATRYGLSYSSDDKSYKSAVTFKAGRVASAEVAPKVTKPKKDYVPVAKRQLASVVDPLSGLMLKGKPTPDALCKRTIPFFDGWSRLDLKLSPVGMKTFSTDGYEGDVVVCNVRIKPVSGYRATSKGVKYISSQTIELWFAPIGDTGINAPVYARIPTEIGPLTLSASTFAKN